MSATADDPTLIVEIGFGVDPSSSGYLYIGDLTRGKIGTGKVAPSTVWTDVTSYVRSFSYDIGKNRATDTWKAGSATIQLNNDDGRFDPANLSGPYVSVGVSQVVPMRPLRIRERIGGVTYTRFFGFVDDVILTYPSPRLALVMFPATDALKVLANIQPSATGAVGSGERSGARINRVLDNSNWPAADRDIDTGDITLQGTTLEQRPLEEMDLVAFCEGGEVFMTGDGKVGFKGRSARLADARSKTAVDTFDDGDYTNIVPKNDADLVLNDIAFTSPAALGSQTDGTNIYRPSADVVKQNLTGTPDASNFYNDVNGPAYSASSYLITNTVGNFGTYSARLNVGTLSGFTITGVTVNYVVTTDNTTTLYPTMSVSGTDTIPFGSKYLVVSPGAPVTASWNYSTNPVTGTVWTSSEIEAFASASAIGFALASGDPTATNSRVHQMWMEVGVSGVGSGGAEQRAADVPSQTKYLVRSEKRTDLILTSDADTERLANWRLYTRKNHEQRFEQVTFKPAGDATGDLWGRVLSLGFFDRITLTQTPPSGITSTGDYFVIGISESCSMQDNEAWSISLNLESATPYTGFLIIGDATLGKIGTGLIG